MHGLFDEGGNIAVDGEQSTVVTGRPTVQFSDAELDNARRRLGDGLNLEIYCNARAKGESHRSALEAPFRVE